MLHDEKKTVKVVFDAKLPQNQKGAIQKGILIDVCDLETPAGRIGGSWYSLEGHETEQPRSEEIPVTLGAGLARAKKQHGDLEEFGIGLEVGRRVDFLTHVVGFRGSWYSLRPAEEPGVSSTVSDDAKRR